MVIQWGLSLNMSNFSAPFIALNPGVSNLLSTSLGIDGDFLLFYNPTSDTIAVEVTITDL